MKFRKITLVIIILGGLLITQGSAQNFAQKPAEKIIIDEPKGSVEAGEKLIYSVEWLGIPSGNIVLEASSVEYKGRQCFLLTAKATPNNFFKHFYDVEYNIVSYIDARTFLPYHYEKNKRYRGTTNSEILDFDRQALTVTNTLTGSTEGFLDSPLKTEVKEVPTTAISEFTLDSLSAIYYLRLQKISSGGIYPFSIYQDKRNWQVNMRLGEPLNKEIRNKGILPVIQVVPDSNLTGFVFGKKDAYFFITTDPRRLPVEFVVGTTIGKLHAKLLNHSIK